MTNDWLVWQIVDSAFPAGGFAHSGGLEAAVQAGEVGGTDELRDFVKAVIWSTARSGVPFTVAACRSVGRFNELDGRYDLLLNNAVANRASRAQGRSLIASSAKAFVSPEMSELRAKTRADETPGHLAVALGAVGGVLRMTDDQVAKAHLFMVLRGVVSAAVRLSVIGPLAAQALQADCAGDADRALRVGLTTSIDDACGASPLIDLIQGTHDRLYSRLFVS